MKEDPINVTAQIILMQKSSAYLDSYFFMEHLLVQKRNKKIVHFVLCRCEGVFEKPSFKPQNTEAAGKAYVTRNHRLASHQVRVKSSAVVSIPIGFKVHGAASVSALTDRSYSLKADL